MYADTGRPVRTDESGRYVDVDGETIETDDFGRPVDKKGRLLPTNRHGQYVYTAPNKPLKPKPRPKISVIGPDGQPQPTNYRGNYVDEEGRALPTNPDGLLVDPEGSPMPTNGQGQFVVGQGKEEKDYAKTLPTDESGKLIYPIVNVDDGQPLPTDSQGRYLDANG